MIRSLLVTVKQQRRRSGVDFYTTASCRIQQQRLLLRRTTAFYHHRQLPKHSSIQQNWYCSTATCSSVLATYSIPQCQKQFLVQNHANATTISLGGSCQSRSFASNNPRQQQHQQQQQQQQKKPQHQKPSEAGRIVLHQSNIKKLKPGQVKLCHGCGTEVRRASSKNDTQISAHQIIAGVDANKNVEISKTQAKKARFADAMAADKGAFLCDRCKALQSENIFRAYDALADVSPEVFSSQLQHIVGRRRYGLCIVVVDSTDPEHSAVKNLRRSIGQKTPIWLVVNKIDLIPKMDHRTCRVLSSRIASIMGVGNFHNYFPVSSITGKGIYELAERLLQTLGGKDVFIVGCANVGKSTLVHRLAGTIATAAYLKGRRGQTRRDMCNNLPVTGSHLPGTTLQAVRIPCFSSDRHALWDTPGIINRKAIQYALFPVHIMEPMARPEVIPLPSKEAGTEGQWQSGYSILIEAAWMDSDDDKNSNETDEKNDAVNDTRSIGQKIIDAQTDEIIDSDDEMDDDDEEENWDDEDPKERILRLKDEEETRREEEIEEKYRRQHEKLEAKRKANDEKEDDNKDDKDDSNEFDENDDGDTTSNKRQAAYEKKMAIVAAAKERRRLKEQQSSDTNKDEHAVKSKPKTKATKATSTNKAYRGPCVLGRIDLINVENGHTVFAQAFLHPALRVRIVPTSEAPDHATVPTSYLNTIRQRMEEAAGRNGAVATKLKPSYSIPLKPFTQNLANGEVVPGEKEYNEAFDSYYMDIVFASLGWIAISHRGKFKIIPHCVEGSVFSKRQSLYPTNLATRLVTNPDYEEDSAYANLSQEEAMDRLRGAAKQGRHAGGNSSPVDSHHHHGGSGSYHQRQQYGGMVNDADLFNYQSTAPEDDEWY